MYRDRGVHGHVVETLARRVLSGTLLPGQALDTQAILDEFDVSRTVLRESLRVLSAKGLIEARPRLGTYVSDRSRWQLLDGDVMGWRTRPEVDPVLLWELGEARKALEPPAARMAALRRSDDHLRSLDEALREMSRHSSAGGEALIEADLRFHRVILAAAGNELMRHFEVILEPALAARNALLHQHPADEEFLVAHSAVRDAISRSDGEAAFHTMTQLMDVAADDAQGALAGGARSSTADHLL